MVSRKIVTCMSKSGLPVLQIEHEGRNLFIHSKYDPEKEAEQILSKYQDQIDQFQHVLFYGVGLGYHVKAFLEQYPEKLVSTYEPIMEVGEACVILQKETGLSFSKLRYSFIEKEQNDIEKHLYTFSTYLTQKVLVIVLPVYERFMKEEIVSFLDKFKEIVEEKRSNIGTNAFFSKRWTINSLMNLPSTFENPNFLVEHANTFRDKPVILAAAGPSLSEEIENLRLIKEQGLAYIFAVGSANKALISHDIHPDAIFTYDPQGHNTAVFKELMDKNITTIPMIYGTSVGFETIQLYPGPKYHFVTTQDTITQHFHERTLPIVNDAYSIAIVTLQILYQLQVEKIILVGQNFAFKNDLFYAQEIKRYDQEKQEMTDASIQKRDTEETLYVQDVFGNNILTSISFNNMRILMEKYILQHPQTPVVNTTRGGAAIRGTTYVPLLKQIKEELKEKIVKDSWVEEGVAFEKSQQTLRKLKLFQKDIELYKKQNEDLFNHFYLIESSIDKLKEHQVQKNLEKIDYLMRKITGNTFYNTVIRPITRNFYEKLLVEAEAIRLTKPSKEKLVTVVNLFAPYLHICRNIFKEIAPIVQSVVLPKLLESTNKKEYVATSGVFHYEGKWNKKAHSIQEPQAKSSNHYFTAIETNDKKASIKFRFYGESLTIKGINHSKTPLKIKVIIDNTIHRFTNRDNVDEEKYGSLERKPLFKITKLKQKTHDVNIEITSDIPHFVFQGIEIDQKGRVFHIDEVETVHDLEIGKRIRCHYESTYYTVGEFSGLGKDTNDFLLTEASANPKGDFYFIMVDIVDGKKKMIADRNIQHSISWRNLSDSGLTDFNGKRIIISNNSSLIRLVTGGKSKLETNNEWDNYLTNRIEKLKGVDWNAGKGIGSWILESYKDNPKLAPRRTLVIGAEFVVSNLSNKGSSAEYNGFRPLIFI